MREKNGSCPERRAARPPPGTRALARVLFPASCHRCRRAAVRGLLGMHPSLTAAGSPGPPEQSVPNPSLYSERPALQGGESREPAWRQAEEEGGNTHSIATGTWTPRAPSSCGHQPQARLCRRVRPAFPKPVRLRSLLPLGPHNFQREGIGQPPLQTASCPPLLPDPAPQVKPGSQATDPGTRTRTQPAGAGSSTCLKLLCSASGQPKCNPIPNYLIKRKFFELFKNLPSIHSLESLAEKLVPA